MEDTRFTEIIKEIKKGQRFMVVSHVSPEADAVGSNLGLALALREMGKDAVAYLEDPIPDLCSFLPGSETVVHTLEGEAPFDCTFAVDCGQIERLGDKFMAFSGKGRLINLDHHATNDNFGELNVVEPAASAAGEVVYDLLKACGAVITEDIATNLYTAIHTDTGSFRYSSATPGAFKKAGELVGYGAKPWEVSMNIYENYPARRFKALALVLLTLGISEDGHIASLKVTLDLLAKVGGNRELVDGFVNYARAIKDVEVGVLFRECGDASYKVSMRSKGRVDVSSVALSFGGGGHKNAAGCAVKGDYDEVSGRVLEKLKVVVAEALA
ncbi:3'-to-5' oligoribonuclease A, Bacillus type [hydrothermal vent metagenome]|uniref:3'-to-5' oligoribonuclease A, Bacillus type n=1 Tax=hydrothermal vent metagenome TaxID=652676 RepID=A0A3B0V1T7_9ZZZZ